MELIAASRIPKAQARVTGSKPYTEKLIEVIKNVGAAGAYASNIIRMAETRIVELQREGRDVFIYAVGKKAQGYFRYRGYRIEQTWLGVTDTPGYGDARAIARTLMAAYGDGRIDAVEA